MIRKYTAKDKNGLIRLLKNHTPDYFAPSEEQDFIHYLNKEIQDYFVVEQEGVVLGGGGINYFPNEKIARLSWDLIHPNYMGKGLGRELTKHRINHILKNKNADKIVVRTTQLVYRFYEKIGFKLDHTQKDFWAKGFDLYQMERQINH